MHDLTDAHGIGAYVLRLRTGGTPVGYAAIVVGRGTVEEPELAYELLPTTGRHRTWATIRPWNAASLRVLDKRGMVGRWRPYSGYRASVAALNAA